MTVLPISSSVLNRKFIEPLRDIASLIYQALLGDVATLVGLGLALE